MHDQSRQELSPLLPALLQVFEQKCAYCESLLNAESEARIEQHRPAMLGQDPHNRDHYWWLASAWSNLLLACARCSQAKRDLFPIDGTRCEPGTVDPELLAAERPLLIDPTMDRPELLLGCTPDGLLVAHPELAQQSLNYRRAMTTIELLELNRPELVNARRSVFRRSLDAIDGLPPLRGPQVFLDILGAMASSKHHAFARRCAVAARIGHLQALADFNAIDALNRLKERLAGHPRAIVELSGAGATTPIAASVRAAVQEHVPTATSKVIRVVIEQFRDLPSIAASLGDGPPKDLEASALAKLLKRGAPREAGWKVFLGENGSGKTSVLHAIAIALMGKEFYEARRDEWVLEDSLRHGARSGSISLSLSTGESIHVKVTKAGLSWEEGAEGGRVFLRGYGANRLLPRRVTPSMTAPCHQELRRVDNLFDPHAPLVDAEAWLASLEAEDFRLAASTLKDVLDIQRGALAFVERGGRRRFGITTTSGFTLLEHFSAGYQSLLALACDIMAGSGHTMSDMRLAAGIVLIDELGTNLHPRWRMEIVSRLATAFPRMQFIASTHEPLCLRGLGRGEVARMYRDPDRDHDIRIDDLLPSPAGYRVDQLLTSEFFGLQTTTDPDTDLAFSVYYDLLARDSGLNAEERALRDELSEHLKDKCILGASRRDRVVLEAVDKFLASAPGSAIGKEPALSDDVVRQVSAALTQVQQVPPS